MSWDRHNNVAGLNWGLLILSYLIYRFPADKTIQCHKNDIGTLAMGQRMLVVNWLLAMIKIIELVSSRSILLRVENTADSSSTFQHVKYKGIFNYNNGLHERQVVKYPWQSMFIWWCLMPLSTIFQLLVYCGSQFYWWRKPEYLKKTTDTEAVSSHWQTLSHNAVHPWQSKVQKVKSLATIQNNIVVVKQIYYICSSAITMLSFS